MALPTSPSTFSDLGAQKDSAGDARNSADVGFTVGNLINQNDVAEGPSIPPPQQGEFRVPRPSGFAVQSITNAKPMGALIVFTWEDIDAFGAPIGEYRILANFAYDQNATPTEVGSSEHSPCTVQVVSPTATSAVFYLRPYLANGQTLPLEQCPTCTVDIPAPVFQFRSSPDTMYIDGVRPQGTSSSTSVTYDISGTFIAPPNVNTVTVECWGSGGNGPAGDSVNAGGGGGGGAYATSIIAVTPGVVYDIGVASGGTGSPSYFSTPLIVSADSGRNGDPSGVGGAAGLAANSVGTTTTNGSPGDVGSPPTGGNGGTAAGGGGVGGSGGTGSANGSAGVAPGGGGGGGGPSASNFSGGAPGRVKITYTTTASGAIPGFGVVNDSSRMSNLTDGTLLFLNANGKTTAVIGDVDSTAGTAGFVKVSDGAGTTNDVTLLSGSAATATGGAATLPGNPVGFLKITFNGTAYRVPYYGA